MTVVWIDRRCEVCGATWTGLYADDPAWCWWCERRDEQLVADQRQMLLWPEQPERGRGYEALDDVGKAVWDRTRGQSRGSDAITTWVGRLERAVEAEVITADEARQAIRRVTR